MYNMEFSPPKPLPRLLPQQSKWFTVNPLTPEEQNTEERPVLILKPFASIPHISFKKVKLGCAKSCILYVQNPLDIAQHVRVENIPSDKGFSIEQDEFSLTAGEEKALTIVWAPEKSLSCRETISFKSSAGCKTQAYLLGTAYSPKKVAQKKVIATKTRKHHRKKSSPKTAKPTISGKNVFSTIFKINEEKKENLDITNSSSLSFLNIPESSNFKFLSTPESFSWKPGHIFPDSPIRRQTYTINSMLLHGRESEVLPLQVKEPLSSVSIIENSWRKNEAGFTLNQSTCNFHNSFSSNVISLHPTVKRLQSEDNLNDSLENNTNVKYEADLSANLNDSLFDTSVKCKAVNYETTCVRDSVETYDIANKHFYFGVTPQQSESSRKLKLTQSNDFFSDENKSNVFSFHDQGLDFPTKLTITNNLQKISSIEKSLSDMDCFKQPFDIKRKKSSLNFSEFMNDSFDLKSCIPANQLPYSASVSNSVWAKSLEVDKSAQITKSAFEYRNSINEIQPNCNPNSAHVPSSSQKSEHSNILLLNDQLKSEDPFLRKKNLSKCNDMKVLKETKSSLLMEIPCDNSSAVSVTSKNSRKQVKLSISKKVCEKKEKCSPFKTKVSKSGSLVVSKEALRKNSSVASKPGVNIKDKEKPSKFMPRKLCLTKSRMSESVVYHRNPFASMNIYYDERWIEKQEAAFTSWLNFVLTPNDEFSSEDVKVDSAKLWIESIKETSLVPAPTKEELSLKAYTAVRNLNLLRKSSFNLYQSDKIVAVIKKIEKEVDLKRISIRKDRAIHADLGIKKSILEMLLSYNTLWLRIGLETVYGEVINLQNNSDVVGLSRFIIQRFLQNPEISSKFSHPSVINYYKKGYDDEIQRFTLKKFLLLVFYLDTAKNGHLIKHNPCLFNKNSKYKASRDLLLVFSREYLSGEGDVTKHLRYLGYKVSYQQSPIEEFDYSVRNIAVDLRCGLRLGRVVELLLEDWTISQMLRINTLNRLTKIHNNDVILKALKNAGIEIENNIEAKSITDGDREKTLDLLWQIIFKTQISKRINKDLLKTENAFLFRSLKLRADFAAYNALRNHTTLSENHVISIHDSKLYKENEILQLLFQWCQHVCAHYGVKVHNFTSSFSDGRILCLLLHHYHPNVLPYESIKFETSSSYFEEQMKEAETSENCPFFVQNGQSNSMVEKLLKNEKDNLTLVFQKFQEVGHIPILSNCSDMSNTLPDEKVMVTLVSYINIRLMELSIEIRAARKILHAWRQYKLRKQHERLKLEIWAAEIIQRSWRKYLVKKRIIKETEASIAIQSFWRMYAAKRELSHLKYQKRLEYLSQNAIIIQAAYRGFSARKLLLKRQQAAIVIQTFFRKWLERSHFIKLKNIAIQIQQNYRAKIAGRAQQQKYIQLRETVIKLQAIARKSLARAQFKQVQYSTIKIQAYVRMWLRRKRYIKLKNSCIAMQQTFRKNYLMKHYRQEYQNKRSAIIAIQKWYRSIKMHQHKVHCVTKIQACVRGYLARRKYMIFQQSVIKIQIWWHAIILGRKARSQYLQCYRNIVYMQSCVRKGIESRKYRKMKESAVTIQKYTRGFIAKREFMRKKKSLLVIQNAWRAKLLTCKIKNGDFSYSIGPLPEPLMLRLEYVRLRHSVIQFQRAARRYLRQLHAATVIQSYFRMWCMHRQYKMIKAAVKIQAAYRGYSTRKLRKRQQAAIVIQTSFRKWLERSRFIKLKSIAIQIQLKYRAKILGRVQRQKYVKLRKTVVKLQAIARRSLARAKFKQVQYSTIKIQAYVRMWLIRKRYIKMKKSCISMQQTFRKNYLMKHYRQEYQNKRSAIIAIQKWYRSIKMHQRKVQCITKIQACLRGYLARRKYMIFRQSVIKIQIWWHAITLGRKTRLQYLQFYRSIIYMQSCVRKSIASRKYRKMKESAVIIQKYTRRFIARGKYMQKKKSLIVIQNAWRTKLLERKIKNGDFSYSIGPLPEPLMLRLGYARLRNNVIQFQRAARAYLKHCHAATVIQSYFRMWCVYQQFKIVKAALKIQAAYRGYSTRKLLKRQRAAIVIQTSFRKWLERSHFIKLKSIAIKIQQNYRAKIAGRVQRQKYVKLRKAVVKLQAIARKSLARAKFKQVQYSTIKIQAYVRMWLIRKRYIKMKKSCIAMQQTYRKNYLMKCYRQEYQNKRAAAIAVQKWYRAVKMHQHKVQCITKIQACLRGYLARRKYMIFRQSVIKIQIWWHAIILGRKTRLQYLQCYQSIVYVQSYVRKRIVSRKYRKMKESAIIIQKYTKRFIARREYMQKKKSLLVIQNAWRTKLLERKIQNGDFSYSIGPLPEPLVQRLEYVCLRNNVIKLQRAARVYLKRRHAATVIQSYFRMWCMQQKFKMIKAALKIQAAYRGFSTRKLLKRQHAAIVIQTSLRRWLERSRFIELKSAAMKIQRNYRAKVAGRAQRQKYVKFRKTVIKLQAIARRSLARAKFKQVQYSTIKIQAYVRMWLIRKRYIKIKKSCIAMQQTFRKNYLMKCYRKEYQNKRSATIVIQKWYRAVKMHQRKVQSITKVQACLRRFLARRKYKIFQQSVIKIQIWWHAIILGRKTRLQYLQCYQSIVYAQSCVRKSIASRKYRKMKESAVTIQKYTRGFIVRRKYMQKKKSLLVIQNAWRAKLLERKIQNGDFSYSIGHLPEPLVQRLEYVRLRNSVIQFQRAARAYLKHHHAATIIQSYFRMWCLQRQFKMIKAVLKIQAAYRGFSTRKLLKREHAAIVIQSSFRKWLGRSRFIKLKSIAIQIQQNYRAKKAGRAQRQKYIKLRETIIKLQAIARRSLVRTQFKQVQFSTVKIQSYIRMWLLRKRYIKMRNSCIAIQQKFRENYLIKLYRQEYQNKRSATIAIQKWYRAVKMHQYKVHCVTKIQACFRRFLAKRNYMIFRQNVIKIQIWWHAIIRGRKVRLQYLQCYRSIVYVQSCVKKSIASRKYRKMKESAVTIQRYTRGFIARREYVQKKKSLLLIQNAWRAKLLARKIQNGDFSYTIGPLPQPLVQRLGYVRLRSSVIQFQRAARVYLKHHHAATVIQSYFRMWCVQRQFKMLKAALKIQACWRGFLVRRSITDKKIFEARKKIKAADSSEAKKLKNRTSRSLELLLIKDVLLQNMLTALQELDVCTQLSPKCCERLVESGGLTILIRLVLCCNRSIPHMELIKLTTNILLNLAKYEKTVNYVWEEEDILVTILHLMKIFREKGAAIFTKCCSLLWIFSQDPNKAQIMTEDSSVIEQIRSFHYLLTRKQSMEQKRIVAKTFISSNLFNSSVLSRTMNSSVFQRDSERSSLQIDPDWKLGKHRRREFKDPVVAITLVMKSLGIASKGGFNL